MITCILLVSLINSIIVIHLKPFVLFCHLLKFKLLLIHHILLLSRSFNIWSSLIWSKLSLFRIRYLLICFSLFLLGIFAFNYFKVFVFFILYLHFLRNNCSLCWFSLHIHNCCWNKITNLPYFLFFVIWLEHSIFIFRPLVTLHRTKSYWI